LKKHYILSSLTFLIAFALTSGAVFALYETTHPWPVYRHDSSRSGYAPVSAPNTNTTLWTWVAPAGSLRDPVLAEGIVYTASHDDLCALDETTGAELWSIDVNPTSYEVSGGPAFADGRVYVGTYEGYLYCHNATSGQQMWYWPTGTPDWRIETNPVEVNGKVYFGTADYDSPSVKNYLVAVNATTGVEIWRYAGADNRIVSSPAIDGAWVFFGCDDGKVYALKDLGSSFTLNWTWTAPSGYRIRSTPCVSGDKVFFGSYTSEHSVFAVNKTTGDTIWQYTLQATQQIENSVALANDVVYIAPHTTATYTRAYALNASAPAGTYQEAVNDDDILLWRTPQFSTDYLTSAAATDDKVLFASSTVLYALNTQDGETLWSYAFGSSGVGEPVVADGRIFIRQSNTLYCFGDFYPPNTYRYPVVGTGYEFVVEIVANATCKVFDYSNLESEKKLTYNLDANWNTNKIVMSNITIPHDMLGGTYTLKVDGGGPASIDLDSNDTHTTIHFTYLHEAHDNHDIEITGTTVIPEFSSTTILPLLIILSLLMLALLKRKTLDN
jgi:outer membrane protein assembly factor BamB